MWKPCALAKSVVGLVSGVLFAMGANCSSSSLGGKITTDSGATNGGAISGDGGATNGGATDGPGGMGGTSIGSSAVATGGSTAVCNSLPVKVLCTGTKPPSALISDFSLSNGATAPSAFGPWGQSVSGGTYVYPAVASPADPCASVSAYPMTESFTNGVWNVTGTVGTYAGMGIWWICNAAGSSYGSCLLDASAYTGISFKISGDAGPKGTMRLNVGTPSTTKLVLDSAGNPKNCGNCATDSCATTVAIPVTSTATTVSLTWAELGVTEPDAIGTLLFMLSDPCNYSTGTCVPTPYSANVSIDDLQFTN
jgi:hypothetical protein